MQKLIEETIEKVGNPSSNEDVFNELAQRIAITSIRNFSGSRLWAGLRIAFAVAEFGNCFYDQN